MYFSTQHCQKKLKNWDSKGLISWIISILIFSILIHPSSMLKVTSWVISWRTEQLAMIWNKNLDLHHTKLFQLIYQTQKPQNGSSKRSLLKTPSTLVLRAGWLISVRLSVSSAEIYSFLGEYLPYSEDALFWDGTDGTTWHNKYPEKWAALNWDALGRFSIQFNIIDSWLVSWNSAAE